jgi:hypothetical protein
MRYKKSDMEVTCISSGFSRDNSSSISFSAAKNTRIGEIEPEINNYQQYNACAEISYDFQNNCPD